MLRRTSSTKAIDGLDVERCYGDVFGDAALRDAMVGCDVVFYCVVDARIWLRDPTPLFRTNVDGLRHVLDAALDAKLKRFAFTSTTGTIAASTGKPATEDDPHNWTESSGYVQSRLAAEHLVMEYARDKGLPAVALCISTTYGPDDWGPMPHGALLALVAQGKFPFYLDYSAEVVGIEDAARAMILAADRGPRPEVRRDRPAHSAARARLDPQGRAVLQRPGARPPVTGASAPGCLMNTLT